MKNMFRMVCIQIISIYVYQISLMMMPAYSLTHHRLILLRAYSRWARSGAGSQSRWLSIRNNNNNNNNNSNSNGEVDGSVRFGNVYSNLITSTRSNTVKKIQALLSKRKKRTEYQSTVVEGPRMIFDLLKSKSTSHLVQQILISEDKWEAYTARLSDLYVSLAAFSEGDDAFEYPPTVLPATSSVMEACSDTVTTQGILAVISIPEFDLVEKISSMKEEMTSSSPPRVSQPLYLVADAIRDPGNLGTLLRSSVATGVSAVYLLPGCCDPWNPKAVRSAMGTTFQLPIYNVMGSSDNDNIGSSSSSNGWSACKKALQAVGCHRVFCATMVDDIPGKSHFEVDWVSEPTALVLGSEGNGLSKEVRRDIVESAAAAKFTENRAKSNTINIQPVYVPMGEGIESLNAAVCGSVVMYEYLRQRQILAKG